MDNHTGAKLVTERHHTADNYEFAELSAVEVEEVNKVQNKLSQDQNQEIILLAYKKNG